MSTTIGVAMIGCGSIGRAHAHRLREQPGVVVRGCVDLQANAARALADEIEGAYAALEVDAVLRDDLVDAVVISTHHDSHARLAVAAAEAGKHIFLEKPLALTREECDLVQNAVLRTGVQLMVGFKMRFMPVVQAVRQLIPAPRLVLGQIMDNRWPDDFWAQDPVKGGGNVASQGVHSFDLLWYLAGPNAEPDSVYAAGGTWTHQNPDVIDNVAGVIRFTNGCVGVVLNGDAGQPTFTSKFFFELFDGARTATLFDRCHNARLGGVEPSEIRATEAYPDEDPEGFTQELREFVACVREGRPSVIGASASDGTRATRLALATFRSVRTGEVVKF